MSNYGFTNADGEPIMDGAAYRYEQYLDSTYEPDPDYYDRYDDAEPDECEDDHACDDCDGPKGEWVGFDFVPFPDSTWVCSYCDRPCPSSAHAA